jgi:UDP-N-acetylmuramoylalanine--D-glutamate ligase
MKPEDYAVVELSSFQLKTVKQSPSRAVITNLSPNHLDWHTGMDEYVESKFNICRHQATTRLVTNADNETAAKLASRLGGGVTLFSSTKSSYEEICGDATGRKAVFERDGEIILSNGSLERVMIKTSDIKLVGRHNVENYMAAIGVLDGLVSSESVRKVARTFGGVEHRLEFVRTLDGVTYYNSSIDTSPSRTAAALSALGGSPLVIAGGRGKGVSLAPLGDALAAHAKAVFLYGETAGEIASLIGGRVPVHRYTAFADAFRGATETARQGDTVLLSPGCTAFGAFRDFEERGERFCQLVRELNK